MSCRLFVDCRERALLELFQVGEIPMEIKSLDNADMQIWKNDETLEMIIERKTFQDLLSSIQDGRWTEQKIRGLSFLSDKGIPSHKFLYIIELGDDLWNDMGTVNEAQHNKHSFSSITADSGWNAITNLLVVYGIPFLLVRDVKMTSDTVLRLCRQINKRRDEDVPANYQKALLASCHNKNTVMNKKKLNYDSSMFFLNCLTGIPGVSYKMATQIQIVFPTLRKLIDYVDEHDDSEFQLYWKTIHSRKLNERVVKFIYSVFRT